MCFFCFILLFLLIDLIFTLEPNEQNRPNEAFDYLILVNKQYKLPDGYESKVDLINVTNFLREEKTHQIERKTYDYFAQLKQKLYDEHNITIELDSVYRSVARQQEIWDEFIRTKGEEYTRKYVAVPGYSEHHTGLAVDICLKINGTVVDDNDDMIAQKEIFAKIHEKLEDYGFILRFPIGKEKITGYNYEPWHLRFVEVENAKKIKSKGVTLEEYLGKWNKSDNIKINYLLSIMILILYLLI